MTQTEIKNKIMKGGKLAIDRLIEKKRKDKTFIVVSQDGKVVKIDVSTLKK